MVDRFQLPTVPFLPANQLRAVKTVYLLVQILATHHCGRRSNHMEGGRGMSVSEVNLTPEPRPSMNSVLLRGTPSLNIHSKLKGQRKTIKFGSYTSLVPTLPPCSRSFLMTLFLLNKRNGARSVNCKPAKNLSGQKTLGLNGL